MRSVGADADAWVDRLAPMLGRHQRLIRRLLDEARRDDRIRILVVGCSIGRGVADELSDIDAYIAIAADAWEHYLRETDAMLRRLGRLMDASHKVVRPDGKDPYQITWALYRDGVPVELVIASAPATVRPRHDWVILHDPDDRRR